MGCHFLLQGIFPTQGLNPCLGLLSVTSVSIAVGIRTTAVSGPWQATRSFRSPGGSGAAGRKPTEWTPHIRFLNTLCVSHIGLTLLSCLRKVNERKKKFPSMLYGPPHMTAALGCLWSARLLSPWVTFPDPGLHFPSLMAPQTPTHPCKPLSDVPSSENSFWTCTSSWAGQWLPCCDRPAPAP